MHKITLEVYETLTSPDVSQVAQRLRAAAEAFEAGDHEEIPTVDTGDPYSPFTFEECQGNGGPPVVVSRVTVRQVPERGVIRAIRITAGKVTEDVELYGLASMQHVVCGLIERHELDDGSSLYVNEEGKLMNLPVNSIATDLAIANMLIGQVNDPFRGDCYVVGPGDGEGNDTDVTDRQRRLVEQIAREAR